MDLRQLEIIRAIAETGSFTAAGNKLHVSQSAISRQILLLQGRAQRARIFARRPPYSHHTCGRFVTAALPPSLPGPEGHHRWDYRQPGVTAWPDSTAGRNDGVSLCVSGVADRAQTAASGDSVKLVTGAERCLAHLRAGTGDLALLTPPIEQPHLVTVPAMQEELLLVTAAKHPLSRKRKILPQDLVRQPFVLFESGSNSRRVVNEFFMASRIEPQIVMETENVEIIKAMVRNGIGHQSFPFKRFRATCRAVSCSAPASKGGRSRVRRAGSTRRRTDPAHGAGGDSRLRARATELRLSP